MARVAIGDGRVRRMMEASAEPPPMPMRKPIKMMVKE